MGGGQRIMSIGKGAFGQSAKGSFIESAMGARGWGGAPMVVLSGSGTTDRYLARLDPLTGAKAWEVALIASAGKGAESLIFNSSYELFVQTRENIKRKSMSDASDQATYTTSSVDLGMGAIGTDIVHSGFATALGAIQRRLTRELAVPYAWTYDAPNVNQNSSTTTDASGNSYYIRIDNTSSTFTTQQIHRWALDANGNLLWAINQTTPYAPDGEAHQFQGQCEADGTYIYAISRSVNQTTFVATRRVFRFLKSDGSQVDSIATAYDGGIAGGSQILFLRRANNFFYVPLNHTATIHSIARVNLSMAELSKLDLGTRAVGVDVVASDSVGTGDVIVVGETSTTWPGSLGERANCWRVSSDLSTIRWGVQVGTAAFNGLYAVSSKKYQVT